MSGQISALKERYANARERHSGQDIAYALLRAAVHDQLAQDVRMTKARAELAAAQARVHQNCKTLRDMLASFS